ncbi:uncharacterized protein LOC144717882 [Lampetra planeri]
MHASSKPQGLPAGKEPWEKSILKPWPDKNMSCQFFFPPQRTKLDESQISHETQVLHKKIEEEAFKHKTERETLLMKQKLLDEEKGKLEQMYEEELNKAKALLMAETRQRRQQEEENRNLRAQIEEGMRKQRKSETEIQQKQKELMDMEKKKSDEEKRRWEGENRLLQQRLRDLEHQQRVLEEQKKLDMQRLEKERKLELEKLEQNKKREMEALQKLTMKTDKVAESNVTITRSGVTHTESNNSSRQTSEQQQSAGDRYSQVAATLLGASGKTVIETYTEYQMEIALKKPFLTIPSGVLAGKTLSIWEILNSSIISEVKRRDLKASYKQGVTTVETIIIIIIEIIEGKGPKIDRKKLIGVQGVRRPVSLEALINAGLLSEAKASQVLQGTVTLEEISQSLKSQLQSGGGIAGILVESTNEKVGIYSAMKRGILSPTTALELLEAQAATGYILDPANNGKLTVDEAFRKGLVGSEFREKLLTAEKIATGFTDMLTGKVLTLQRVLQKRPDLKVMAVNLLEVQAATGGIIEPQASIRLPLKMAYEHNVIDTDMFRILSGVGEQAKGFHDPDTGDKISYKDLLGKCVCDSEFGFSLLPVKEKEKDRRPSSKSSVRARKIIIIDPDTKREMTVYEAYRKGFIDVHTYYKLTEQEGEWKETVTIMPDGSVSTLLMDSKSGKEFNIDDALAKGILTEASFKQYKEGSISVSELAGMLSASAPVHEVQPSSPRTPQTGGSAVFVEYGSLCSFNDPTEETTPVAGILDLHEKEYITIKEAMKRHLVDGSTGQKLFEAQACTGGIIDPATGQRYSLDEAVAKHLIDKIMKERIQLAEKAFKGFEDARNKTVISTAQAMKKGSLYTEAGQRYLEVQYLTGGLIEPGIKGRVPIDEALQKGTISEVMIKKLRNVNAYAKYMICPKTKAKISYKEAMDRSKIDAPTGLRFLEASTLTSLGVSAQQAIAVSGSSSSFGSASFFGSGSSSVDSGGHSTGFSTHTFSGQTSFSSGQRVATSPTMLSNESDHFLGVGSVSESSKLLSDTEAPEMMMHVGESDSSRSLQPSCDGASHKVKAADGSANLFNSAGTYRSPPLSSYAISHEHVDGSMLGNTPEQLIVHHPGYDYLTLPEKQNAEVKDDENVTYYILKKSPPGSPPNKMSDTDFDSSKINVTSVVYSSGSLADYMAQPTKENVIPAIADVVNTLGVEGLSYENVSGSKTTSPSTQNLKCVYSDEGLGIKASNQHHEDELCAPLDICESELYNQGGKNVTGTSQKIEGAPQSEKRSYFEHDKGEKPSMSENSFYNFSWAQRWQKEQGCLVPQNELVECPRNGVAVYFGLDKTLLGDSDDDDLSCDNSPKAQASCSVVRSTQSCLCYRFNNHFVILCALLCIH